MAQSPNVLDCCQSLLRNSRLTPQSVVQGASGWTSVLTSALVGMLLGAPGGLLLSSVEVLLLDHWQSINIQEWLSKGPLLYIVLLPLCMCITILSSTAGVLAGSVVYSRVIRVNGEQAGDRQAVAGPVCLMLVSATGAGLGTVLFRETFFWGVVCSLVAVLSNVCGWMVGFQCLHYGFPLIGLMELVCTCVMNMMLVFYIFLTFITAINGGFSYYLKPLIAFEILSALPSLFYAYIYHYRQFFKPIVVVPLINYLILIVVEIQAFILSPLIKTDSIQIDFSNIFMFFFNIILPPQFFMNCTGMIVFDTWQRGGAVKICLSAVSCGAAVLGAVKLALPVLGSGPSVGAVMGVVGAVGVSMAAAGAAAQRYGPAGRLGVTLGAAGGAFVASCGLSVQIGLIFASNTILLFLIHSLGRFIGEFTTLGTEELG